MLSIETAEWGWTGLFPGFGLLQDEFASDTPALRIWKIDRESGLAVWEGGEGRGTALKVTVRPFCGEMGVARGLEGKWSTIPPYNTGGNVDTRYLTAGSTLYLPVEVEGALFSCGVSPSGDL